MITDLMDELQKEECDRIILLIRHGEKVQPPEEDPFRDVGLTDNGASTSFHLGEKLRTFKIQNDFEIHSSPLKRCVETAKNILQGIGTKNNNIKISSILGNPGPYVKDEYLAGKVFTSIPSHNRDGKIIDLQLEGHILQGFRGIEEGSRILLQYLFCRCDRKLCIAVSHDTIILPLIGFLYGGTFNIEGRVDYLDGVIFCIKKRKITMHTKKIANFDITYKVKEMKLRTAVSCGHTD
jgi:hypothetical protein